MMIPVSFAHLMCHDFLQLLAPNLTCLSFHEDLACSTMMIEPSLWDQLAGWPAQLIATTNCCSNNGPATIWNRRWWFSKCGSWFRLDSVWHRPVLGQLPVMSQEIFRVHVSLQKCLLSLPTMLHRSSPWLQPRHNNTFFNVITTRINFLRQATTFYLSNTYHYLPFIHHVLHPAGCIRHWLLLMSLPLLAPLVLFRCLTCRSCFKFCWRCWWCWLAIGSLHFTEIHSYKKVYI